MNKIATCVTAVLVTVLLTSCGSRGPQYKGPHLVSYQDNQRGLAEPNTSSSYGQIADRLSSIAQDVYIGNDASAGDAIVNQGRPSKGLRVLVKGTAIQQGIIGKPKEFSIASSDEQGKMIEAVKLQLDGTAESGFSGSAPDLRYQKDIRVGFVAPTVKGGEGNVEIFVYPLESSGESSCVLSKKFNVLDETQGQVDPQ